jgi:hypothetical protein
MRHYREMTLIFQRPEYLQERGRIGFLFLAGESARDLQVNADAHSLLPEIP